MAKIDAPRVWLGPVTTVLKSTCLFLLIGVVGIIAFDLDHDAIDEATVEAPISPTPTAVRPTTTAAEPTDVGRQVVPSAIGDIAIEDNTLIALTWAQCVTLQESSNGRYGAQHALEETVGPVPLATPVAWQVACDVDDELKTVVDALGPGRILAEIEKSDERLILFCRTSAQLTSGSYLSTTLFAVYVVDPPNGPELIVSYDEVARPSSLSCGCHVEEPVLLDGDEVLYGHCRDGGSDGASTAFAVAFPVSYWPRPVALDIRCGGTWFVLEGNELVLHSRAFKAGGSYDDFPFPDVRFHREGEWFIADDLELLTFYGCDFDNSGQLLDVDKPQTLSYQEIESAIGTIGVHDEMLVALTGTQCQLFFDSWYQDNRMQRVTAESPIMDLTGLRPPDGFTDWFYTCDHDPNADD